MSDRHCDFSDLPVEQCSHCIEAGNQTSSPSGGPSFRRGTPPVMPVRDDLPRAFRAAYDGVCAAEGDRIEEGDLIVTYHGDPARRGVADRDIIPTYAHKACL